MKTPISVAIPVLSALAASGSCFAAPAKVAPLVSAGSPIKVEGTTGGFDFLKIDAVHHRLLAAHTGNGSLDVFDLADGKLIKSIATGKAQDAAVDDETGTYMVSVSKEKAIVFIDATTLEVTHRVELGGPADAIVWAASTHELYAGHDDGKELWVIDGKSHAIVKSIPIGEGPEVAIYDAASNRVFQNIKSDATVLEIDPATHAILHTWPTAPATAPHGLAYNPSTGHLFCAGANLKLAVLDAKSGKAVGSVNIAKGVDEIAFDPATQRVYSACGSGKICIAQDSADGIRELGEVDTAQGARSIAFDAAGSAVWIAFTKDSGSYIQRFDVKS